MKDVTFCEMLQSMKVAKEVKEFWSKVKQVTE
jgi:hypothetical protein